MWQENLLLRKVKVKLCWEQTKKLLKNVMTGTKFIPTSKVINKTKQQAAMIQLIEHCICNWKIRFKDHCKLKIHYVSGYLKTLIMAPGVCKISQAVQSFPNSFWIVSLHMVRWRFCHPIKYLNYENRLKLWQPSFIHAHMSSVEIENLLPPFLFFLPFSTTHNQTQRAWLIAI